jgi:hypothetical protein
MYLEAIEQRVFYKVQILLYMVVKRKVYSCSLKNFKKLKNYLKKLNNGRTKINRQDSARGTDR